MSNRLDIIVFGATGYTAKFTLVHVHKLVNTLTWGIAGRNEAKLKAVLIETAKRVGVNDFSNIPIIIADVEDEESIKRMTAQAKVVINCCGPFDEFGEVVVKSCIETGTHYVDISGEIQFIGEMMIKYQDAAREKGVYIVSACGFDCIPTDLGICFVENNFTGTINSVQTYMQAYEEGGNASPALFNVGTWSSAVISLSKFFKMYKTQNKLKLLKPINIQLKPKLSMKFLHRNDSKWALPFPTADEAIVRCSQQFFYEQNGKRPIQMHNYIAMTLFNLLFINFLALFIGILAQFKFSRSLLLKYPGFFSLGYVTHLPLEEKTERLRFSVTLKCQGWSNKLLEGEDQYQTPPNKEIIACVSGVNPGYRFTGLCVTLSALMILTEPKNLPSKGGVYTPAITFSKTSLVEQLQNNGVEVKIVSVKDLL